MSFDFGLSAAQETHAAALHRDSIVFDMLSMYAGGRIFDAFPASLQREYWADMDGRSGADLLVSTIFWPFEVALDGRSDLLRAWLVESGLTCGAFDIDLPHYDGGNPLDDPWDERLSRYAALDWVRFVRTAQDIRDAKRDGVIGFYANYQPVVPLLRDLEAIERAWQRGLRSLMLTYNRMDHLGSGCTERQDAGLSLFGLDVVRLCNRLGLMVDTSHCGDATTLDACRHSRQPVNANHSCARALYDHPRGKTDEALRAIADTGGVIGILALPYFLTRAREATVDIMLDHIEYVANLVGWQHVAIGSDWPIQAPDRILESTMGSAAYTGQVGWGASHWRDVTAKLVGFEDARGLVNVTRGLVARGWRDDEIRAVIGGNALRVFEAVCG